MRYLPELLEVLIAQIPSKYDVFITELRHCQVQACYSPPELLDA